MELSQRQFNVVYSQDLGACIHVLQYTEATNSEITAEFAFVREDMQDG